MNSENFVSLIINILWSKSVSCIPHSYVTGSISFSASLSLSFVLFFNFFLCKISRIHYKMSLNLPLWVCICFIVFFNIPLGSSRWHNILVQIWMACSIHLFINCCLGCLNPSIALISFSFCASVVFMMFCAHTWCLLLAEWINLKVQVPAGNHDM